MRRARVCLSLVAAAACGLPALGRTYAQTSASNGIQNVKFDQRLGDLLPLDQKFRDDSGREVALREYFGRKPVVLIPVYFRCPLLCNQTLNGLTRTLRPLALLPGRDFEIVAFSFDPDETPELARAKKANYIQSYGRSDTEPGWHFLTGSQLAITALTKAIGFQYSFNPQTRQFTHAAGLVVTTAEGRIARYFFGIDYPPRELEEAIDRAGGGRIGSPIRKLLLLCYDYDSATGKYTLSILRTTRILGSATAIALFGYLAVMFRRDRRKAASRAATPAPPHHP